MGATLSPAKCHLALSECERKGWSNSAAARKAGFLLEDEVMTQIVNGKRLADDVTVASKVLCGPCICEFLETLVYKPPLAIEVEEVGRRIGVGDLSLQVLHSGGPVTSEILDFFLNDKNSQYLVGAAPHPPRIRWEPFLGYQSGAQCARWLTGRFYDIVYKNRFAVMAKQRTTCGVIEATVEMLLLNYPLSMVRRALGSLRNPVLAPWRKIATDWLRVCVVTPVVAKELQDAAWRTRLAMGLC